MKYQNPVLTGFYPDPSICRVGEDFYLVNSTFEFFPGVVISHSRDLVHWKQIGHCITRNSQVHLYEGEMNSTGLFAPTIRYHDGVFYMVVTNVAHGQEGTGNFYVFSRDPAGEWSDPVFLHTQGIDPSFFFDDDGRSYYTGTSPEGIYLREMDFDKGALTGESVTLWGGTGGAYPEGPHIYKKNGWYYLMISEGGTERCHMLTMARSRAVTGPYEPCPDNPVMTNRSLRLPIESTGHADLVEDQNGNWWAVCLGTRPYGYPPRHNLGRETMLVPVDWSGEWPVFGDHGRVLEEFETELLPGMADQAAEDPNRQYEDDFSADTLDIGWNYLYNPDWALYEKRDGALCLHGNEKSLKDPARLAWIGRRQKHHVCRARVTLSFPCVQEGEEAGMTIYMNDRHHYEAALTCQNGARKILFRRQIGSLVGTEVFPAPGALVTFLMEADRETYRFSIQNPDGSCTPLGQGEVRYLTTEVGGAFTGNYIALYSSGNGQKCRTEAVFTDFSYEGDRSDKFLQ